MADHNIKIRSTDGSVISESDKASIINLLKIAIPGAPSEMSPKFSNSYISNIVSGLDLVSFEPLGSTIAPPYTLEIKLHGPDGTYMKSINVTVDKTAIQKAMDVITAYATGSDATAMTIEEINATGVANVNPDNLQAYKNAVAGMTTEELDTIGELQLLINNVNAANVPVSPMSNNRPVINTTRYEKLYIYLVDENTVAAPAVDDSFNGNTVVIFAKAPINEYTEAERLQIAQSMIDALSAEVKAEMRYIKTNPAIFDYNGVDTCWGIHLEPWTSEYLGPVLTETIPFVNPRTGLTESEVTWNFHPDTFAGDGNWSPNEAPLW